MKNEKRNSFTAAKPRFFEHINSKKKIDLIMILLYYIDEEFDKKLLKFNLYLDFYNIFFLRKLLILVSQNTEEYKQIMKICVQFHLNSIARLLKKKYYFLN